MVGGGREGVRGEAHCTARGSRCRAGEKPSGTFRRSEGDGLSRGLTIARDARAGFSPIYYCTHLHQSPTKTKLFFPGANFFGEILGGKKHLSMTYEQFNRQCLSKRGCSAKNTGVIYRLV